MGLYIEGLNRPRNEYMRIHIDFDGEVWVFRGSGWKLLGIKATNLDLVRCEECIYHDEDGWGYGECKRPSVGYLRTADEDFCSYGERRADYTIFTVNPPKGVETPLKGDATVFHKKTQK